MSFWSDQSRGRTRMKTLSSVVAAEPSLSEMVGQPFVSKASTTKRSWRRAAQLVGEFGGQLDLLCVLHGRFLL